MEKYQKLIDRALDHIQSGQSPDGSFTSLSGFSPTDFSTAIPRRTTFFTSNILACLQNVRRGATEVKNAAAEFLFSQKSDRWSFNYWARPDAGITEAPYPPYPDDLDDTFSALAALLGHNPAIIDGHAYSSIAKMLTARETREGGPYRTWLVGDDASAKWQDTDLVVNSTIGYFLLRIGVHLPALERFVGEAIRENRLASPYYPGVLPVAYFLSRFYKARGDTNDATVRIALADTITQHLRENNGMTITTLERAMAISSLVNIGHPERVTLAVIDTFTDRVEREGFLPYAFCIDPARDGKRCYAGSSALTAAFCAEALTYYNDVPELFRGGISRTPSLHEHIRTLARASCATAGTSLREAAVAQIDKTTNERITMLAYDFREALYRNGTLIPSDIAEQLSLANLYGWMAYDIYDDVLDDDDGAASIPCANFFLRALAEIYSTLATKTPEIALLFRGAMDGIDNANAWEQRYCRLPAIPAFGRHRTLADRSIGHAMGPLAELLFAGYGADSGEYRYVESLFRHYLIARQIHDDAHDWSDDLLHGRVNSVGALVMARFKKELGSGEGIPAIATAMPELRAMFWRETVDNAVAMIVFHVEEARRARQRSHILDDTDFMESELRKLESGAHGAIKERDDALIFLNDYRSPRPSGAPF